LICKGAVETVVARCTTVDVDGRRQPLDGGMEPLLRQCDRLAGEGFRVLAVAFRDVPPQPDYGHADERELVLRGYVAFLDPPKDSARAAVEALGRGGVRVKVLTGDSELVTAKIGREVGIDVGVPLLGPDVAGMTDGELAAAAEEATVMARLLPLDKERRCSSTSSSTCAWVRVPTSATCSASWRSAGCCRSCRSRPCRC